jgi:hypothetical protein
MSDRPQQLSGKQRPFCSDDGRVVKTRESQENQGQNVLQRTFGKEIESLLQNL